MAILTPLPFGRLIARMFRELEHDQAIFDLPASKFFRGEPDLDISVPFHGKVAATPFGPAAGPHTQLAQNIVLAWLAGARILELKTVQIMDELVIGRPCIDMQNVGYNIEWSQELKLEESLEEYVKASMLIRMLAASGKLELAPGTDRTVFDMSVGYDLKGIQSPRVQAFIRGMLDATPVIDRLRREIPEAWRHLRDLDFAPRISDTLTLSTFHGCPSHEIEGILDFLMRDMGLHCIVKLNPTLLGRLEVRRLMHEVMGYTHVHTPDAAFDKDTSWEQAAGFVDRLGRTAESLGLGFGVKFSNTLIVENHRDFFPRTEKEMYLSGPPLFVLAMNLVRRFRQAFGDRFPISFSAGIDKTNFPDAVSLGLVPVTVCSDLLKVGGYARAHGYFQELFQRMRACGATTRDELILRAHGQENTEGGLETGVSRGEPDGGVPAGLEAGGSRGDAAGGTDARRVSAAKLRNTEVFVEAATRDERYALERNARVPRKVGSHLVLFDCLTCDKCIPVCPNNAIFTYTLPRTEVPIQKLTRGPAGWEATAGGTWKITKAHQIAIFADFCNECGNCDVFCPEDGGPYAMKPVLFGSLEAWKGLTRQDGFHIGTHDGEVTVHGRFQGREFRATRAGERAAFTGDGFSVTFQTSNPASSIDGDASGEVDLTYFHMMDWLQQAVLEQRRIHYLNA